MSNHRHQPYTDLMRAVDTVGETPCMAIPEVFFPEDFPDKNVRDCAILLARYLCNTCPIKNECFMYAQETDQRYGVWAGTLPSER